MSNSTEAVIGFFVGALSFWLPSGLIFAALDTSPSGVSRWIPMTIACPLVAVGFYSWMWRRRATRQGGPSTALFQLVGIWMLAPLLMYLGSLLTPGRSHAVSIAELKFLLMVTFVPFFTFYAAAIQGSGYGLLLISIILPIQHLRHESGRWLVPKPLAFWRARERSN